MRSTIETRIMPSLIGGLLALLFVRWIRLRGRGPIVAAEEGEIDRKAVICQTATGHVVRACTDSAWSHFWDGLPYCDDVASTCILYGGTVIRINPDE
jgi:hypothetical protein